MNRIVLAVLAPLFGTAAAPTAAAAPPGFPDLNAFAPVDSQHYLTGGLYRFLTSDGGTLCSWEYIPAGVTNPHASPKLLCSGAIPGIAESIPDTGGPGCARATAIPFNTVEFALERHGGHCAPWPPGIATLNPGQRIDTGDVTCVVGEGDLVACIEPIQEHGFVLAPSGSWVF